MRRRWPWSAALILLPAVISMLFGPWHAADRASEDLVLARQPISASAPITVIAIDDETLASWPGPRAFWGRQVGRLIRLAHESGAEQVGVAMEFTYDADGYLDQEFGVFENLPNESLANEVFEHLDRTVFLGPDPASLAPGLQGLAGLRVAPMGLRADRDGVTRRIEPGSFSAALSGQTITQPLRMRPVEGNWPVLSAVTIGDQPIPELKGRKVLIGLTFGGAGDTSLLAGRGRVPSVIAHADAVANLLSGSHVRPALSQAILAALGVLLAGILALLVGAKDPGPLLVTMGSVFVLILGAGFAAPSFGYLIPLGGLLATSVATALVALLVRSQVERQRRAEIEGHFGTQVSPQVMRFLLAHPEAVSRVGVNLPATIMFLDVRNFTPISESFPPAVVADSLNQLLDPCVAAIQAEEGHVMRFTGDGFLAVFGTPIELADHASRAERAARKILTIAREVAQQRTPDQPLLDVGIGLHSGDVLALNVGARGRQEFTLLGDPVNTAARVESATKSVGFRLLISHQTRDLLPTPTGYEGPFSVDLKGKGSQLQIFGLDSYQRPLDESHSTDPDPARPGDADFRPES